MESERGRGREIKRETERGRGRERWGQREVGRQGPKDFFIY